MDGIFISFVVFGSALFIVSLLLSQLSLLLKVYVSAVFDHALLDFIRNPCVYRVGVSIYEKIAF